MLTLTRLEKGKAVFIRSTQMDQGSLMCSVTIQKPEGGGVVVSVPEETGRFGEFLPRLGRRGFGNLSGEFWLGLDKIHNLTNSGNYFRVDLEDFDGKSYYTQQDLFKVAGEGQKYKLSLGSYSGLFSHHFSLQISDICHIGKRAVKCKQ